MLRKEINKRQYHGLVKFMIANPTFATNKMVISGDDKCTYYKIWEQLSLQLNMKGPPKLTAQSWKQVWIDHKYKIISEYCRPELNRCTGETENQNVVYLIDNETAILEHILNAPVDHNNVLDNTATSFANAKEDPIKTELFDEFTNVTDATEFVDFISTPTNTASSSLTFSHAENTPNLLEEQAVIEKQLDSLKKEKSKIGWQIAELKLKRLQLKEKLRFLKQQNYELNRKRLIYKAQQLELKVNELQMNDAAQLRNSINCKFKKIF